MSKANNPMTKAEEKLAALVADVVWEQVQDRLHAILPAEYRQNMDKLYTVYRELTRLPQRPSPLRICLHDPVEGICGKNGELDEQGEEILWGLEAKPWAEWLGMGIDSKTLQGYSAPEIVAHCLWEMTWHGYDQAGIRQSLKDMRQAD